MARESSYTWEAALVTSLIPPLLREIKGRLTLSESRGAISRMVATSQESLLSTQYVARSAVRTKVYAKLLDLV